MQIPARLRSFWPHRSRRRHVGGVDCPHRGHCRAARDRSEPLGIGRARNVAGTTALPRRLGAAAARDLLHLSRGLQPLRLDAGSRRLARRHRVGGHHAAAVSHCPAALDAHDRRPGGGPVRDADDAGVALLVRRVSRTQQLRDVHHRVRRPRDVVCRPLARITRRRVGGRRRALHRRSRRLQTQCRAVSASDPAVDGALSPP